MPPRKGRPFRRTTRGRDYIGRAENCCRRGGVPAAPSPVSAERRYLAGWPGGFPAVRRMRRDGGERYDDCAATGQVGADIRAMRESMLSEKEVAYLKSQPLARLATVSAQGQPDVA